MTLLGVDVSHWNPEPLPWPEWVAGGLSVAVVQITHGGKIEQQGFEHYQAAAAASVPNIAAYHFLLHGAVSTQVHIFTLNVKRFGWKFAALDVEDPQVTADDVLTFCAQYDADQNGVPLVLYGNNQLAAIIAAHPELKRYAVWWANYPLSKARISVPPIWGKPSAPASLNLKVIGWQFSGTGRLSPYQDNIDLSEWYELPIAAPSTHPDPLASSIAGHALAIKELL